MKVIHVLNYFLPYHVAGTEVYVMSLMKSLKVRGIEGSVIIPNYGKNVNESYSIGGFKVWLYSEPSIPDRTLQMGRRKADGLKNFEQLILRESPAVIHFHELAGSNGIGLEHVKLAKKAGFKTVMTFHLASYTCKTGTLMYKQSIPCDGVIREKQCSECYFNHKGKTNWQSFVLSTASSLFYKMNIDISTFPSPIATALGFPFIIHTLRKNFESLILHCDALVVISKWYEDILKKNTIDHSKIHFIPQGLPFNDQHKISQKPGSKKLKLVFIGRISHFKGVKDLIIAISSLPYDELQLDIYGEAGELIYMEECKALSLSMPHVHWKGKVPTEDVVEILSAYDVLCLPSVVCEMAPLVIQEAFAAGIPVLASNVYGNAEMLKDGENGWLFKFKDINDLQLKIKMLIDNRGLISSAKKNIPAVRDFCEVSEDYDQLYNWIIRQSQKIII